MRSVGWAAVVGGALALLPVVGQAADGDPTVDVPLVQRQLSWPAPADVLDDLRARDWAHAADELLRVKASALSGTEASDHAFVTAWALVRADRAEDAVRWLEPIRLGGTAPAAYRALIRAEVLRAAGQRQEALATLDEVVGTDAIAVRAALVRVEILRDLGRTADAADLLDQLAARPDPAPGAPAILWAAAQRHGLGSDEAYPLLRRLWAHHPGTDEGRRAAATLAERYPERSPTLAEVAHRATALGELGAWTELLALTEPFVDATRTTSPEGCRLAYARTRALYKRNELSAAVSAMGDAGTRCVGLPGDEGAKLLYLGGEALFRRGSYQEAATTYAALPTVHPRSSMADDGLTRSGIAWWEAGDKARALATWQRALDEHPGGDTTPEAAFRLAFAHYDAGRPGEAVTVADRLGALEPRLDEVHVPAGRYWSARWRLYPDVAAPARPTGDAAARQEALRGWAALAEERPHGWYAALAWSRLRELDPERAGTLGARRPPAPEPSTWVVPADFAASPAVIDGVALARVGLVREALDAWAGLDLDQLPPDAVAWLVELRVVSGDWLEAHERLHRWLRTHPLGTLGPNERAILRLAYPDRYAEEVRDAASSFPWPWRLFHALVREESLFNARVVSHAGARGLAQLMPGTARDVAKGLGVPVGDLFDPANNTRLGGVYLDAMIRRFGGAWPLAFAAYNAGPGRVDQWLEERGALPLDEWVERIPFRETRGYVKRVTSTWQVFQHERETTGPAYVDLSRFNHSVRP